jgi:hypothetical protein
VESAKFFWAQKQGDVYCEKCFSNRQMPALLLHSGTFFAIRHIIYSKLEKLFGFNLSAKSTQELSDAAERYVLFCLERPPKTLGFYKELQDLSAV